MAQLPHRLAQALLRGLLCIPFVIWLSIIASIFLFKLQIERWLGRPYDDNLSIAGPRASAEAQDRRPQLCGRRAFKATSDSEGNYRLTELPAGADYVVEAEAQGFEPTPIFNHL